MWYVEMWLNDVFILSCYTDDKEWVKSKYANTANKFKFQRVL